MRDRRRRLPALRAARAVDAAGRTRPVAAAVKRARLRNNPVHVVGVTVALLI
jgi:hypothetical protein